LVTAEHVHGRTGLDGPALPEPGLRPRAGHGVDFIVDTVMAAPEGAITLCALGPLTNVAAAIIKEPRLATRLEGIVIMGGGWSTGGNVTPAAEFNIHVDPHAAAVVLGSRARVTMIPLDCTHQVLTTAPRRERIRALGTPVAAAVCAILDTYDCYDFAKYGDGGAPLHDPCVIAQVIWPALFAGRRVSVEIETASELTMGMTVVDWWGVSGRAANADFIRTVDAEAFFDNLTARLARY
jgi:purine nucleosidase